MTFLLSAQNVVDFLVERELWSPTETAQLNIELKPAKNFNLLLSWLEGRQLLVKQERHDREGKTQGEFLREWRIQEFLPRFPELSYIRPWLPEALHFDREHSVIVFNYLNDYRDLANFYAREQVFPTEIAAKIGSIIGTIHRITLDRQDCRDFFWENLAVSQTFALRGNLERISPEVFGQVPRDGLKFFALYQRYDSLGQAIARLRDACEPCCLTHNDLKLNNILLLQNWEQAISQAEPSSDSLVRVIDWERSGWGDPAFDLGMLIASYLQLWLLSLIAGKDMTIEESLRLATTPLSALQPSIAALAMAYFEEFPEILERRPNFLTRVVQFSGLALIQTIQAMLQHQKSFGNQGICLLQVAKALLCRPESSIPTVFGMAAPELTRVSLSLP